MSTKIERGTNLTAIDKVVMYCSPEMGVRRMAARHTANRLIEFGYNDKPEHRGRAPQLSTTGAETWRNDIDRRKAMADARDLCRYDFIGGIIDRIVLYVAGRIHCKSNTGDAMVNEIYDEYYHGWCGDERDEDFSTRCDVTGRHRHKKQAQMAFRGFLIDGDAGFVEVSPEFSPTAQMDASGLWVPGTGEYCLQSIEADRIGSPLDSTTDESYIGGITINRDNGRVQNYRIFQRSRTGKYTHPEDILPRDFIHVFDPDTPDEYRGRTKLLRLLNDTRDLREWCEAEKIAGKTQSLFAAFAATKDPFNGTGPDAWSDKTANNTPTMEAKYGMIQKGGIDQRWDLIAPPSRPSGAFMAFVDFIMHRMAVSLDLPYEFIWSLAMLGGVNSRIIVQQATRKIEAWQNNILRDILLDRARQKVIADGIAKRILPAHPNWKKCDWRFGPALVTDMKYEMESDIQAIAQGIVPIEKIMAKYDNAPREVFTSNSTTANEAIEVGTEKAIPVEVFARGMFPDITAQRAAMLAGPTPPPLPGSIEAVGDKGVKELRELLVATGEGKIDRESAINTLIQVFGFSRSEADKIVPEEPEPEQLNRMAGLDVHGEHPAPSKQVSMNGKNVKH
jgi:hypothetical protein